MQFLKYTSATIERYRKIKGEIGMYWLDRLVQELQRHQSDKIVMSGSVIAVLQHPGLELEIIIPGLNIVTNDGDEYYAEAANPNDTPTNNFGSATGRVVNLDATGAAPGKASNFSNIGAAVGSGNPKAFDGTYPKSDDGDADNTGALVDAVTYRTSYTTGESNGLITRIAIHLNAAAGTDPILMYAAYGAPFTKTSSDTLKSFVNHEMLGV